MGLAVSGECTRGSQDVYVPFDAPGSGQAAISPDMPATLADPYQKRCSASQALTGRYDLDGWRLDAVAAWQRLHYDRHFSLGSTYTSQPERWRQQVQELRLSTTGTRAVDGVLGLYRQRVTQSRSALSQMQMPGMQLDAFSAGSRNTSESTAFYGDATWHATRALDLSAGLRYSRDKASTRYDGSTLNGTTYGQAPSAARARPPATRCSASCPPATACRPNGAHTSTRRKLTSPAATTWPRPTPPMRAPSARNVA